VGKFVPDCTCAPNVDGVNREHFSFFNGNHEKKVSAPTRNANDFFGETKKNQWPEAGCNSWLLVNGSD